MAGVTIARPSRRLGAVFFLASIVACEMPPAAPPIETAGSDTPLAAAPGGEPSNDEAADAGCEPTSSAFVPAYHAPPASQGSCSGPQLQAYYASCFGSNLNLGACAEWANTSRQCNDCLVAASSPAGDFWGPILIYPTMMVLNQGGCVAVKFAPQTLCAEAIEEQQECEHAACDTQGGTCLEYVQSASAQCAGVDTQCFVTSDVEASFIAITSAFCE
jgi:hypothetical protein